MSNASAAAIDDPTRSTNTSFRFIDLPTELRLMTYEHTMTYKHGLEFIFTACSPTELRGTFRPRRVPCDLGYLEMPHANPFAVLSKQLYEETDDGLLIYKDNDLFFDEATCSSLLQLPDWTYHGLRDSTLEAWRIVRNKASPQFLAAVKRVCFITGKVRPKGALLMGPTSGLDPGIQFVILLRTDFAYERKEGGYNNIGKVAADMVENGEELERFFQHVQFAGRMWRIRFEMPGGLGESEFLRCVEENRYLLPAQFMKARGWILEGI